MQLTDLQQFIIIIIILHLFFAFEFSRNCCTTGNRDGEAHKSAPLASHESLSHTPPDNVFGGLTITGNNFFFLFSAEPCDVVIANR